MEKQYVCVYTLNIPRTMTFDLYIHVCTLAVHTSYLFVLGIYLSVRGSSLSILFHTLKMQNLSLPKVFP